MSNRTPRQAPSKIAMGVSSPQSQSNKAIKQSTKPPVSKGRKHAALKGNPTVSVSAEQWKNINQAIEKTVDQVLARNINLDSFGPDYWEMDGDYGIALVAEIRRAIKETCTLKDPKLQREIRKMACDVTHGEFRFPYKGGGVWFRFKSITKLTYSI